MTSIGRRPLGEPGATVTHPEFAERQTIRSPCGPVAHRRLRESAHVVVRQHDHLLRLRSAFVRDMVRTQRSRRPGERHSDDHSAVPRPSHHPPVRASHDRPKNCRRASLLQVGRGQQRCGTRSHQRCFGPSWQRSPPACARRPRSHRTARSGSRCRRTRVATVSRRCGARSALRIGGACQRAVRPRRVVTRIDGWCCHRVGQGRQGTPRSAQRARCPLAPAVDRRAPRGGHR